MIPSVSDVFAPEGFIARRLPHYEIRPEQADMADAVARAIENQKHLVVEAGTGVGKSFAYLVPCILAAAQRQEKENKTRRIVISTHTISLQEQLISRDIPFLNSILPVEFSAVLVKGRGNYLSLRRLQTALDKGASLFENEDQRQLLSIRNWANDSYDGSLAELNFSPQQSVWDEVRSEHGNCLGKKCPTYKDCFYYRARRRVWNTDVLIVNHALFFADLALRREGASVLPDYDVAVFDEAHTLEDVAASHLGMTISNGQFNYLFNKLYNDRGNKGLLIQHNLIDEQRLVAHLRITSEMLFDELDQWREQSNSKNGRVRKPLEIENSVSSDIHDLSLRIRTYAADLKDEGQQIELSANADRLDVLGTSLISWIKQRHDDSVYWVETGNSGRARNVKLMSSPVDVGTTLRDELFNQVPTVILTSATLAVGQSDFSFFRQRIGLSKATELQLGSPFDYQRQATLVLPDRMPDPGDTPAEYEAAVIKRIQQHVRDTSGGVFVLFTSYRMLQNCSRRLTSWFAAQNRLLLCQGEGQQRNALLERFRKDGEAVLFGTETFWQGVDVPGDALKNVIITKLPFSVPDHPLLEARVERIRERGGNPFTEYQVPEAAIKLRQGFGRLIRSATDTGQVVILDPRVRTKPYGRIFLASLPDCRRVVSPME
ncbi:ATP-dependent DNA helicase [Planctomicrobium piriforme]|uniref:DNA 5'-3' helicase n=1 Tax=Planctomicrobium piriforme TaxID=1576369 RepID=A0A1I3D3C6_9PLAN|nr:helicase C-terminal domain-containing protein [Planctomicrobium piriforme]SFH81049.1 ATP-dependent DNA helicase DinG [Planctomicrobium piriforme]